METNKKLLMKSLMIFMSVAVTVIAIAVVFIAFELEQAIPRGIHPELVHSCADSTNSAAHYPHSMKSSHCIPTAHDSLITLDGGGVD